MSRSVKNYMKQGGDEFVIGGKLTLTGEATISLGGIAAGAGLSPLIWDDIPLLQMLADPTLGVVGGDDFVTLGTDGFPYDIVGANGTFLPLAGQQYGVAEAVATGADNDESYVSSNNNLAGLIKANATNDWAFETRIEINQIATAQGVFVGLSEETGTGVDFMTDDTMAMKVLDGIGFQIIAATDIAAVWQTIISLNGGARVAVDADAANAAVAYVKLGMKCVAGTVTFYVDGLPLDDTIESSATNFPLDQVLEFVLATKCGSGVENSVKIDWWKAAQLR